MITLARLARAEVVKLTTTKVLIGLTIAAIAFGALNVTLSVYLRPQSIRTATTEQLLQNPDYITNIIGAAGNSAIFILILGIIGMTGEYRHMTITSTFLTTPRRSHVLIAKMAVYALAGAIIGCIAFAATLAIAIATLSTRDHAPIQSETAMSILGGIALAFAIYAVLGIAIGALVRNQVATIVGALVWVLIVEALLTIFVDWIGKWLPGGALRAVLETTNVSGQGGTEVLTQGQGALLLLGYAVLFGAIASVTTLRRDIT